MVAPTSCSSMMPCYGAICSEGEVTRWIPALTHDKWSGISWIHEETGNRTMGQTSYLAISAFDAVCPEAKWLAQEMDKQKNSARVHERGRSISTFRKHMCFWLVLLAYKWIFKATAKEIRNWNLKLKYVLTIFMKRKAREDKLQQIQLLSM